MIKIEPSRLEGLDGQLAMLYRLLWHAGRYRIPDVHEMTVLECAIALGVDQHARRNKPFGMAKREDQTEDLSSRMTRPTEVILMDPAQLMVVMNAGTAAPG